MLSLSLWYDIVIVPERKYLFQTYFWVKMMWVRAKSESWWIGKLRRKNILFFFFLELFICRSLANDYSAPFFFFLPCHSQFQLLFSRYFSDFLVSLMSYFPQKSESKTLVCLWIVLSVFVMSGNGWRARKNKRRKKTKPT